MFEFTCPRTNGSQPERRLTSAATKQEISPAHSPGRIGHGGRVAGVCALAALLCFAGTGCAGLRKALYQEVPKALPEERVTNTVTVTNFVTEARTVTNLVAGTPVVVTNISILQTVTPEIRVEVRPAVTITNLVPRSEVALGAQVLEIGGSASGLPWAGAVVGGLMAIIKGYAARKNKLAELAARGEAESKAQQLRSVITGVEDVRLAVLETKDGQELDRMIKEKLMRHQEWAGVIEEVGKVVKEVTGTTKGKS